MNPSSILSYYPTYSILDEVVTYSDFKSLNIFVDLKNCLQSLYMKHTIENIIESTKQLNGYIDTSIFSSILPFMAFHKLYAIKRNVDIKFYFFFDMGHSHWHLNIDNKYKVKRRIDDLYGLDKEDINIFFTTVQKNLTLINKALNKLPHSKVICLEHLETDFIPYYLLKNDLIDTDNETAHVIYSNDHDLLQCLYIRDNVFQFRKSGRIKSLVKKGNIVKHIKVEQELPDELYPLAMAIIGDIGDDVTGIKKIGPANVVGVISDVLKFIPMDELYLRVEKNKDLFDLDMGYYEDKILNKLTLKLINEERKNKRFSRSLKLVSFELLSRELESPSSTEMVARREHIQNVLDTENIAPFQSMKKALEMNRIYLEGEELETIYFDKEKHKRILEQGKFKF